MSSSQARTAGSRRDQSLKSGSTLIYSLFHTESVGTAGRVESALGIAMFPFCQPGPIP